MTHHLAVPLDHRAEPRREGGGAVVVGNDVGDHPVETLVASGVVAGGQRGLVGIALALEALEDMPAEFGFVPTVVEDHADAARRGAGGPVFEHPHAVAAQCPVAEGVEEPAPCAGARVGAADPFRTVGGAEGGEGLEVAFLGAAQDQAPGLDDGDVLDHA